MGKSPLGLKETPPVDCGGPELAGLCGGVDEDGGGCFKGEAAVSGGPVDCAVVFGGVGDAVGY